MPQNTLIITGAGSNLDYEFLTGADLRRFLVLEYKDYFLSLFGGGTPAERRRAAEEYAKEEIETFSRVFLNSRVKSIDYFLQLNPNFAEVGKIGIICAIAKAESNSRFAEEAPKAAKSDWYSWLYNEHIAKHFQSEDIERVFSEIPIRFITFNYDRSIEHFLFTAIAHALPQETVRNFFLPKAPDYEFLNVRHMYGKLARLPWQHPDPPHTVSEKYRRVISQSDPNPHLVYGQIPRDNTMQYVRNINLIGERIQQDKADIAGLFQWADRIFFLGFGFAQENLEALSISSNITPRHNIFGTVQGFLTAETSKIRQAFAPYRRGGSGKMLLHDIPILTLLRTHLI